MKSQIATTVSGHVFAYPTVRPIGTGGSLLLPPVSAPAAHDAPQPLQFATAS
jgi:hypothetical protein